MADVQPVTKASFVLAYAEYKRNSYEYAGAILNEWDRLHENYVGPDEIDEDPS